MTTVPAPTPTSRRWPLRHLSRAEPRVVADPRCPRCEYDLRGVVDSWKDCCPVEGVCSECGLAYEWRDVLVQERRQVSWLVEHARGLWRVWASAWGTAARLAVPPRFWARVRMHHKVVPGRLVLWLAVLLLPLHVLIAVPEYWITDMQRSAWGPMLPFVGWDLADYLDPVLHPVAMLDSWLGGPRRLLPVRHPQWLAAAAGASAAWILMVLVISDTRRKAKVHWKHLLRASVYSLWWLLPLELLRLVDGIEGVRQAFAGSFWRYSRPEWFSTPVFTALVFGWTLWYWWQVLHRGWKIERAGQVWLVLLIPSVLLGGILWCAGFVYSLGGWG